MNFNKETEQFILNLLRDKGFKPSVIKAVHFNAPELCKNIGGYTDPTLGAKVYHHIFYGELHMDMRLFGSRFAANFDSDCLYTSIKSQLQIGLMSRQYDTDGAANVGYHRIFENLLFDDILRVDYTNIVSNTNDITWLDQIAPVSIQTFQATKVPWVEFIGYMINLNT